VINYFKDPLNKAQTAYDYFSKKSDMLVSPESTKAEIRKAYEETLKKHPEEFKKAGEMWNMCNTIAKRLKMDFFYYIKDWNNDQK